MVTELAPQLKVSLHCHKGLYFPEAFLDLRQDLTQLVTDWSIIQRGAPAHIHLSLALRSKHYIERISVQLYKGGMPSLPTDILIPANNCHFPLLPHAFGILAPGNDLPTLIRQMYTQAPQIYDVQLIDHARNSSPALN